MLSNVNAQVYIQSKNKKVEVKLELSRERVLLEIARMAYGDIRRVFDNDGHMLHPKDLDDDTAATVKEIEVVEVRTAGDSDDDGPMRTTTIKKLKFHDKPKAIDMLARHLGLLKPDIPDQEEQQAFIDTPQNRLALALKLAFILSNGVAAREAGATIEHQPQKQPDVNSEK